MSTTALHTLYAVDIDPITEANAVFVDQVSDYNVDPAVQETLQSADGQVDPTFVATMFQSPRVTFTTSALATVLAKCSNAFLISGMKIDSDGTHDGAELWFQKLAEGAIRASGSSHIKLTINEALLVARAINATQGGIATIGMELIIGYDGSNEPIVIADNQALVGSPTVSELFTLGPVKINGTALEGIQSVSIDPGITEIVQGDSGEVWPTFIAIMGRAPMITINTTKAISLSTFGLAGTPQSADDSVIYLRKLTEGQTRVADAVAEHISFTIDAAQIRCGAITGSHAGTIGTQVQIRPTWDGSNDILIIDPACVIA